VLNLFGGARTRWTLDDGEQPWCGFMVRESLAMEEALLNEKEDVTAD
jgi:hypothetical protein